VTATTVAVGSEAERHAEQWLRASGLTLVRRNYRCRGGELDLVMRDGDTLVFVEVRFRQSNRFGGAAASVDRRKQRRVATAEAHYLQRHGWNGPCRFDVVAIGGDSTTPDWIQDAFQL
jgi:putative endonuclease